jgi:phospholipid-transporting ATPase
MLNSH